MRIEDWRNLGRHPESAAYPDWPPRVFEEVVDRLRRYGVFCGRKIRLYEGLVWDGWQLYRACRHASVEPEFEELTLPDGMTLADAVEIANDFRRHEPQEVTSRRAEERRARVAEARAKGQSIRAIAAAEGVSVGTVHRDLDGPGVQQETGETKNSVEQSESPRIAGIDGKSYPLTNNPPVLCPRCARVGAVPDCPKCAALKKLHKPDREPGDDGDRRGAPPRGPKAGAVVFDWKKLESRLGPVMRAPEEVARAYAGEKRSEEYRQLAEHLGSAAKLFKAWRKRLAGVK